MKNADKVAERYLKLRGYEKLGNCHNFLVFNDENGELVFVNVLVGKEGFIESSYKELKPDFEQAMLAWFAEHHADEDFVVRCDELCITKVSNDRALIRHYINALNPFVD